MSERFLAIPVIVAVGAFSSCSDSSSYRLVCIAFDKSPGTVMLEVEGRPGQVRALYEPPAVYIGPRIEIPKGAQVFGALIAVHSGEIKAVPLHTWKTDAGEDRFGCNGPAPQFAHVGSTQDELVQSIAKILGRR